MDKIAIVGAGVSGLSTAHFLNTRYKVTLFERESIPGGLIKCQRIKGSLFHTCGGHVFNSKYQDILNWFWAHFRQEDEFIKTERNSVVFMGDGQKIPYPIENHMYLFNEQTQKEIIEDLLNLARHGEYEPNNFEEFLQNRFGETFYKLYFQPYNEKVWRRNLKQVSLSWLEGKLPMPTIAEIIYNNINHVKEKAFVHSSFWYEKNNGSQYIADTLANGLEIRYNNEVTNIKRENNKWFIGNEQFDKVIFCGNIKDIPNIIEGFPMDQYSKDIENLKYHGTTAVFCEIDKNPYSWIYLPDTNYESHRIICTGNFATSNNGNNIPSNRITATIEFTDEITEEHILYNLSCMPLHPKYITHKFNKYTYPIQDIKTRDMIKRLKADLSAIDFYLTGRFADWEYYNMDVAMEAARNLCQTI